MGNFIIYIIILFAIILIAITILAVRSYYRHIIRRKEHDIVYHIREQEKLLREVEYINVEKNIIEKIVQEEYEGMVLLRRRRERAN